MNRWNNGDFSKAVDAHNNMRNFMNFETDIDVAANRLLSAEEENQYLLKVLSSSIVKSVDKK